MIEGERLFAKDDPRQQAFDDALRSLASMPDPEEVHSWLDDKQIAAIAGASNRRGMHITHPYTADGALMRSLRMAGLVDMRGAFMTNMGVKVWKVIRERES